LNIKFDIIKLFTVSSRHALKVGCGLGLEFYEYVAGNYGGGSDLTWKYQAAYSFPKLNLLANYGFDVSDKVALGVFYNNLNVGLSLRRNF
jgi:hypothetical protein